MHAIYEDTQDNKTVRIYPDSDPMNPRTDWDGHLGTMVCFHGRYQLGDVDHGYYESDYDSWDALAEDIQKNGGIHLLPLYLYDHSGITMKTGPFMDSWDSGQVGFIFTTRKDILDGGVELTDSRIEEILIGEVAAYDNYIRGDVYGYVVTEAVTCDSCSHVEEKELDSCWGFYSVDDALEHADWKTLVSA